MSETDHVRAHVAYRAVALAALLLVLGLLFRQLATLLLAVLMTIIIAYCMAVPSHAFGNLRPGS